MRSAETADRPWWNGAGNYFVWQRKVFKAVASRQEVCFAEVPVIQPVQPSDTAVAAVQCGDICVKVYAGADTATLQAILQAVRLC